MISISISQQDFAIASEYEALRNQAPQSGAIVFFVGLVRDLYAQQSEESVEYIELEHYSGMTEQLCRSICQEAQQRFAFDAARVVHRVGKLHAGEQIVFVAVASRHRQSAFDAAQYIMDYLKTRATLWKKEVGSRGALWVGMKDQDKAALERWQQNTGNRDES